jgi:membrane protease YdiL (CAAX protease family)
VNERNTGLLVRLATCVGMTGAAAVMVFVGIHAAKKCADPLCHAVVVNTPSVLLAVLLLACGLLRRRTTTASLNIGALSFVWLPLLHLLYVLRFAGLGETPGLLAIAVHSILLAFWEEAVFRGVVLDTLRPAGTVRAAVISALLFGLLHLARVFDGMPISDGVVLCGFSFSFGLLAAALRLRIGRLWPIIAWHAALDVSIGLVNRSMTSALPAVGELPVELYLFAVAFVAYGLALAGWRKRAMLILLGTTSLLLASLVVADLL